MATTAMTMLFKGQKKIASVPIDVFLEENHASSATATQYALEDGATISDHIFLNNDTIEVKGEICAPMYAYDFLKGRGIYYKVKYEEIKSFVGQLITIVTGLKTYTNVAFVDFQVDRDASTGGGLGFSAKFEQKNIVVSQTTTLPSSKIGGSSGAKRQAQAKASAGKTAGAEQTAPAKRESIFDRARGDLGIK